ncbi:hypothetical protein FALBO_10199 [Fusarium albosuccineum]|uniref:Uncharacterized protein n=1 Tax=Fusarium albosuccineum TaxID=1237068 RepID=A0A8H4L8C5_9HYPO|nr:hypothetical protein FALBO_10199 [Fusarium albosuccineum]
MWECRSPSAPAKQKRPLILIHGPGDSTDDSSNGGDDDSWTELASSAPKRPLPLPLPLRGLFYSSHAKSFRPMDDNGIAPGAGVLLGFRQGARGNSGALEDNRPRCRRGVITGHGDGTLGLE